MCTSLFENSDLAPPPSQPAACQGGRRGPAAGRWEFLPSGTSKSAKSGEQFRNSLAANDLQVPLAAHCTGVNLACQVAATRPNLAGRNGLGKTAAAGVGQRLAVGRRTIVSWRHHETGCRRANPSRQTSSEPLNPGLNWTLLPERPKNCETIDGPRLTPPATPERFCRDPAAEHCRGTFRVSRRFRGKHT